MMNVRTLPAFFLRTAAVCALPAGDAVNDRPRTWGSKAAYDGMILGGSQATHPKTHTPRLRAVVASLGGFGHSTVSVPSEFGQALGDAHAYSVQASPADSERAGFWLRSAAFHVRHVLPSIVGLDDAFAFSVLQRFAPSSHRAMRWGVPTNA